MAKKSRLKGDAFDWIEKKTGKKKSSGAERQPPDQPKKKPSGTTAQKENAATKPANQTASSGEKTRVVYVQYQKKDGQIVAMQEILYQPEKSAEPPWLEIPDDREASRVDLTDDLEGKKLIEIHQNYRVSKSDSGIKLVPKD